MEREEEVADASGRKRKRRVHAVEYCFEPELEGARPRPALFRLCPGSVLPQTPGGMLGEVMRSVFLA